LGDLRGGGRDIKQLAQGRRSSGNPSPCKPGQGGGDDRAERGKSVSFSRKKNVGGVGEGEKALPLSLIRELLKGKKGESAYHQID